jgi:hypothetical protein
VTFSYTVTGGTGAYASATGSGTLILLEMPGVNPPPGMGAATTMPTFTPRFSMLFSPGISVTQTTGSQIALLGDVSGGYTTTTNADGSSSQALTAAGLVQPVGSVQASGTVSIPASTTPGGQETATITLTGSQGTITLSLTPAPLPPGSPLAGQGAQASANAPVTPFKYTITGGTGAYASATGSGLAILLELPPPSGTTSGSSGSQTMTAPMFTLLFLPGPF